MQEADQSINSLSPNKDERTWAMLCHFSAFLGCIFPIGNIIAPLIIWLSKRDKMPFVRDQGREVLNFQISMVLYFIIAVVLCFVLIGIPILIGLAIFEFIFIIVGGIRSNDGECYRYPITIRFLN
tara:strand:+ start:93 stop:467 length:375 start_codon:yes stop_codon:yes gene_type:complete